MPVNMVFVDEEYYSKDFYDQVYTETLHLSQHTESVKCYKHFCKEHNPTMTVLIHDLFHHCQVSKLTYLTSLTSDDPVVDA